MTAVGRFTTGGRGTSGLSTMAKNAAGRAARERAAPVPEAKLLSVAGSRPYPWPFDGAARPGSTALLVVAAQRAVASHCPSASVASAAIGDLVATMRWWGGHVAWTRHARSPGPNASRHQSFLPAAHGPERGPAGRQPSDVVVHAYGVDGFSASPLAESLTAKGITHLLLAGFGLEGPVHSTLRSANDRGWECLLVSDACAAFDPLLVGPSLSIVEMSGGIFGATASAHDVLGALEREGAAGSSRRRRPGH